MQYDEIFPHILPTNSRHLLPLKKCSNILMLNEQTFRHLFLRKTLSARVCTRTCIAACRLKQIRLWLTAQPKSDCMGKNFAVSLPRIQRNSAELKISLIILLLFVYSLCSYNADNCSLTKLLIKYLPSLKQHRSPQLERSLPQLNSANETS